MPRTSTRIESPGTTTGPSPLTRRRRPFLFCTLVLLLMAGFEIFARVRFPRQSAFWSAVDYADRPIDVLFVGSSRVAAAVDVDAFKAETSADLYVVNAAGGYSTPAEY